MQTPLGIVMGRWTKAILDSGLAESPKDIRGADSQEISELEKHFSLRLPLAYRDFLSDVGRKAGSFLVGTDWKFDSLNTQRGIAESVIKLSESEFRLPEDAFVFASHQGYQFLFFRWTEGDDPPVWHFIWNERQAKQVSPSFSAWASTAIDDESQTLHPRD